MAGDHILQWNCRGLRAHREEIELLIVKYSPAVICLQETKLKPDITPTFKYYTEYYKSNSNGEGGVCILVKNSILHSPVTMNTNLEALAVCYNKK